ncbi:MAG: DUF6428 family protein [Chthoniobacterales bacterium]
MNLHQLKAVLRDHPGQLARFILPDGDQIPAHVHVTEVGHALRNYIDCGGATGKTEACLLQTWVGEDTEHRLTTDRLHEILLLGGRVLPHEDLEVEVEYDCCVVGQYVIGDAKGEGDHLDLHLENKRTQCRARERRLLAAEASCCGAAACC